MVIAIRALVPKTTMDEDSDLLPYEGDVWPARNALPVQSITPKANINECLTHQILWLCILSSISLHHIRDSRI
jgi:hypothetical protein